MAQDDPFVSPYSGPDLSGPTMMFVKVVTAITTAAALSAGKTTLGPAGAFSSAMKAFSDVTSIETGMDRTLDDPLVKVVIGEEGINSTEVG